MLLGLIPRLPVLLDEPLGDASIIPTYLLLTFTREHVKVALGGDGGDELFAGYPTLQAHRLASLYMRAPGVLRRGVGGPGGGGGAGWGGQPFLCLLSHEDVCRAVPPL